MANLHLGLGQEMAINLRGTFLCCHNVLPQMVERKEGVVINIGSSSGTIPEDMSGAYGATKWVVIGYTTSLAKSVRPHGVRVNGLNPGWVETVMTATTAPPDMTRQFINLFGANDHSGHAPGPV